MRLRAVVVAVALMAPAACTANSIPGTPTSQPVDSRAAFAVFDRPAEPEDAVPGGSWDDPEPIGNGPASVPDSRRLVAWDGTNVYLVHSQPDWLCLVVQQDPPAVNTGNSGCNQGAYIAAHGVGSGWVTSGGEHLAVLVYPDAVTVTVQSGTTLAAGIGVLALQGTQIRAQLSWPDGRTELMAHTG